MAAAPTTRRGRRREHLGALHQASGSDHAAGDRDSDFRRARLFPAAGRAVAEHRLSGDRGAGEHGGREPGHHGVHRGRTARTAALHDCRCGGTDLDQLCRFVDDRGRVRPEPRHQRRGPRRRSGDPGGARRPAHHPAQQSDLPPVQPGRRADHGARAHLRHAHEGAVVRLRGFGDPAAALAGEWRGADYPRRRRVAVGAGRTAAGQAEQLRHRHGRRARGDQRGQRRQCQGPPRPGQPAVCRAVQRPDHQSQTLPRPGGRLPERRARVVARCRPGQGLERKYPQRGAL